MGKIKKLCPAVLFIFIILSFFYICPQKEKLASSFRSDELTKVTEIDNDTEKTYYKDENGEITIAADYGFAISIASNTSEGKLIQYFNDKGEPIKRSAGFYALLREYDEKGNIIRITYLDDDRKPVMITNGYAIEEREYNDKKQIISVRYYDISGKPACTEAYGYGRINEYDEEGQNYKTTYIDSSGKPMMTGHGYASIIRQYYPHDGPNKERVDKEFYYDDHGKPVALSLGQYGIHKEYNELGQGIVLTYLDSEGNPIATNKGYSTIVRTFKADNNVETEEYYDIKGKAFSLSEGQYGVKYIDGQTIYLDEKGTGIFNLKTLLYNSTWIVIPITLCLIIISVLVNHRWNAFLLILCICTIVYLTLMFRDSNRNQTIQFLDSYKRFFTNSNARADVIRNIWLFIPLGSILYQIYPKKRVLFIPFILSAFIEGIQYFSNTGYCELDDVICNSLGGCIGYYASKLTTDIIQRIKSWRHIHIA